jgi:hypothetical protein
MKWGAGHLESTRVLKARAVRETHTHLYFYSHTQSFFLSKDKENTSSFLGTVVGI